MAKYEFGKDGYKESQSSLHICTRCESDCAFALSQLQVSDNNWSVSIYCPNCRTLEELDNATDYQVEQLDDVQGRAAASILACLREINILNTLTID